MKEIEGLTEDQKEGKVAVEGKAKTKTAETIAWIIWLIATIVLCFTLIPVGIISLIILIIAFPVHMNKKHQQEFKNKWDIPIKSVKVKYLGGYDHKICNRLYMYYENDMQMLNLWEAKTQNKEDQPYHIAIKKDDIIAFTQIGDVTQSTKTKGGGASIGGAVVGDVIAGPVGAIIGGRKKVKTTTTTTDTRRLVLKFKENDVEQSMLFDFLLADTMLSTWIPEKKV